jgi:conjugative relaxase-like TrwC/TraI family protein
MARNLIRGQHPVTGEQLVAPKVAVPAAAKLSLGPLVGAVNEAAQARGIDPATLFDGVALSRAWATAERSVGRRGGRAVARVDEAVALAEAAGLDPATVWGGERVGEARAALYEPRAVRDEHGEVVLGEDGTPKVELVEARQRVGIAGYDIGINVPKSMSVLLAMAPDELVARIEDVYAQAARRGFSWTESRTSYVKRGHHGGGHSARQERSSGMAGWVMTHRTARPVGEAPLGDPHWHVHITVANLARAEDGTWLTVAAGGRELMRHAPAIDKVTQAQVRAQLHTDFGITFARSERTGVWEVEHIPQEALDLFSKRSAQVNEALAALGVGKVSPKESRVLTRACRSGKSETTAAADVTLREYWRAQALSAGYDPADWMPAVLAGYRAGQESGTERANETMYARHGITLDDVVARLTDPDVGLTAHTRRFSHLDAITATADALPHGASTAEVEELTDLVLSHPSFVALPERGTVADVQGAHAQLPGSHKMTGGQLYTTGDVPAAEQAILDTVAASQHGQGRALVEADTLEMAIAVTEAAQGYALSGEQRHALEAVLTGGRSVESLLGPAGTGKTTLMRTARVAWQAQGYVVAGTATAAVAAQGLVAESGIESLTVAQWLWRIEHGPGLAGVDVLVLDEANLTDDRDRAKLWAAAKSAGVAQILEVHDPKQLRGVGCGSMSGYIHAALEGPQLSENRRQRSEDERAALAAFREGRFHEALSGWAGLGQVVATHTSDQGIAEMISTWMRLAEGAPDPHTRAEGLLMLAHSNEQVSRINEAVQAVRAAQHQLGEGREFLLPAGRAVTFHLGDQVLLRTNDRTNKATSGETVLNGYRAVVTRVDQRGVQVAWREPGDAEHASPHSANCRPDYIAEGGLELGYALTTHKAEGMTIGGQWDRPDGTRNEGTVLVWAPGMDAPGQYVAASRDRGQTLLFGALEELEGEREQLLYGVPRDQAELTERAIAAMAERAAATATSADDRPVLVDLGHAPTEDDHRAHHTEERDRGGEHDATAEQAYGPVAESEAVAAPVGEREPSTLHSDEDGRETQRPVAAEPVSEHETPARHGTNNDRFEQEELEHWQELTGLLREAEAAGDPDAMREAFDQRRAYERESLGAIGQEFMRMSGTWEQYTERRAVTDEQRERWAELREHSRVAWRSRDPEAQRVARAAQDAFAEQIGPERAERLRLDDSRRWKQRRAEQDQARAQAADERERVVAQRTTRRQWLERPHSTLTDTQLERAITEAEEKQATHLTRAEQARTKLAEAEEAVAAGRGPRVTNLDASLIELRRIADLRTLADEIEQQRHAAERDARTAWASAYTAQQRAELTPWYRSGRRDRLVAEAAELRAHSEQARAAMARLREQLGELNEQSGQRRWWSGDQARDEVAHAETDYGQNREQAHRLDENELDGLRRQISSWTGDADTAATQRSALAAEQQLRADMSEEQRGIENGLRAQWLREQREAAAERREAEEQQQREYYLRVGLDRSLGLDRSPGLDRSQGHGLER